jgi:hypothetical protein
MRFIFKVQQKGEAEVSILADGMAISYGRLSTDKLRYYLEAISVPTIFVIVDLASRRVCWLQLQGNTAVHEVLRNALEQKQSTVTVHVPVAHELPSTFPEMVQAVSASLDAIIVRNLQRLGTKRVLDAARKTSRLPETAAVLRGHSDSFRCEELNGLEEAGEYDKVQTIATKILESESETASMRLAAALHLVRAEAFICSEGASPARCQAQFAYYRRVSEVALRVIRFSSAEPRLRQFSRVFARAMRLAWYVDRDIAIHSSLVIQQKTGDDFTRAVTMNVQQQTTQEVLRQLLKIPISLDRLANRGGIDAVPHAWLYISSPMNLFLRRLYADGKREWAAHLNEWLVGIGGSCRNIALRTKSWEDYAGCALSLLKFVDPSDDAEQQTRKAEIFDQLQMIEDLTVRERAIKALDEMFRIWTTESRTITIDDEIRIYRSMAAGLGVNVDDPDDEIAGIVRIGLADLNPERVLKNCEFLFVSLGSYGIPAQMLGLPTAGSKWIHCTRHGVSMMGLSLDETYRHFKKSHCDGCEDCKPHPSGWKWSREWQQSQDKIHAERARRANDIL